LHILGVPVPEDMDGRVLIDALSADVRVRSVQTAQPAGRESQPVDMTPEEQAEVEERLRALGYLG
jgi:hypothetical protein